LPPAWGLGARPPEDTRNEERRAPAGCEHSPPTEVEVPGIEPGSCAGSSGLLRAQSAVSLLDPTCHANEQV